MFLFYWHAFWFVSKYEKEFIAFIDGCINRCTKVSDEEFIKYETYEKSIKENKINIKH